eukprot:1158928-Pelagomonas_calceolata.AAC.6
MPDCNCRVGVGVLLACISAALQVTMCVTLRAHEGRRKANVNPLLFLEQPRVATQPPKHSRVENNL